MKHDATHYALIAGAWIVAIVAGVVLWQLASELPQAMPLDDFQRTVRKLRSDALEAQALAQQLAQGQLTERFSAEQHRRLGRDLENVRKALDKPPPRGHEDEASKVRSAIDRLDTVLKAVPTAMADAGALRRLAEQEGAIARELPGSPP